MRRELYILYRWSTTGLGQSSSKFNTTLDQLPVDYCHTEPAREAIAKARRFMDDQKRLLGKSTIDKRIYQSMVTL